MKKLLFVLSVLLIVFSCSAVFAEDVKVTVGVKGWFNTWKESFTESTGNLNRDFDSPVWLAGPSLNIRYSNFFVGALYMKSMSDYTFKEDTVDPTTYHNLTNTFTVDRQDLDVFAGYMFTPRVGMFVGYKTISADKKLKSYDKNTGTTTNSDYCTYDFKGPGLGLLGNLPLNDTVTLYGNLAYMSMKFEQASPTNGTGTATLNGFSAEAGISFGLATSLSGNIGYKIQQFSGTETWAGISRTLTRNEDFSGVTVGLNYTF